MDINHFLFQNHVCFSKITLLSIEDIKIEEIRNQPSHKDDHVQNRFFLSLQRNPHQWIRCVTARWVILLKCVENHLGLRRKWKVLANAENGENRKAVIEVELMTYLLKTIEMPRENKKELVLQRMYSKFWTVLIV